MCKHAHISCEGGCPLFNVRYISDRGSGGENEINVFDEVKIMGVVTVILCA